MRDTSCAANGIKRVRHLSFTCYSCVNIRARVAARGFAWMFGFFEEVDECYAISVGIWPFFKCREEVGWIRGCKMFVVDVVFFFFF